MNAVLQHPRSTIVPVRFLSELSIDSLLSGISSFVTCSFQYNHAEVFLAGTLSTILKLFLFLIPIIYIKSPSRPTYIISSHALFVYKNNNKLSNG